MRSRFRQDIPFWVAFYRFVWPLSAIWLGAAGPAFAATGAGNGENGAISGVFFADAAVAPGLPAIQGVASATLPSAASGLCRQAIAAASAGHQLPPGLLSAIATVESGRLDPQTGAIIPWPWTIDANGTGYVYDSAQSAIQAAAGFEAAGVTSLDIGCLQVNLAQHPDAFQTLAEAFDPAANANYAAAFLTGLQQKLGGWPQAVAAYHSQTPALGAPYAARVYAAWQGSPDAAPAVLAAGSNGVPPMTTGTLPAAYQIDPPSPPMAALLRSGRLMNGMGFPARDLAAYRANPVAIATHLAPRG